jgi:hypothetical protein
MHISLDALGPNETEVKVRDLSASEAERRLDGPRPRREAGRLSAHDQRFERWRESWTSGFMNAPSGR